MTDGINLSSNLGAGIDPFELEAELEADYEQAISIDQLLPTLKLGHPEPGSGIWQQAGKIHVIHQGSSDLVGVHLWNLDGEHFKGKFPASELSKVLTVKQEQPSPSNHKLYTPPQTWFNSEYFASTKTIHASGGVYLGAADVVNNVYPSTATAQWLWPAPASSWNHFGSSVVPVKPFALVAPAKPPPPQFTVYDDTDLRQRLADYIDNTGVDLEADEHGWVEPAHTMTDLNAKQRDELYTLVRDIAEQYDGTVGVGRSKYSKEQLRQWLAAFYRGDVGECYSIEVQHSAAPSNNHPGHPSWQMPHIIWQPAVHGEVPAGQAIVGPWGTTPFTWDNDAINNYLVVARCKHPQQMGNLSRNSWVTAHLNGDKYTVDTMSLTAQNSLAAGSPKFTSTPTPVRVLVPVETKNHLEKLYPMPVQQWPLRAMRHYATTFDLPFRHTLPHLINQIRQHRADTIKAELEASRRLHLTRVETQPDLGGFHRKVLVRDQHDKLWLFKPAPDGKRFRADTEHHAHQVARAWGFRTADSRLVEFDGAYGIIQRWHLHSSDLTGRDVTALTLAQLIDVATEHVLDWGIDNDDGHAENLLALTDGHIAGIDKGRAWRYFGAWNGLSGTTASDSNCSLVCTRLYEAIMQRRIPQETTDSIFFAVLGRARRMEKLPDEVLIEHITAATEHRPHFDAPSYQRPHPNAVKDLPGLIEAALARKNRLHADFLELWTRVYLKAGYTLPDHRNQLGLNIQGHPIYTGLHDRQLHDTVRQTKNFGTPTFFAGPDLEDAHLLLWRERTPTGSYHIRLHGKIRKPTLDTVIAYCKARAVHAADENQHVNLPHHVHIKQLISQIIASRNAGCSKASTNMEYLHNVLRTSLPHWLDTHLSKQMDPFGVRAVVAAMQEHYLQQYARLDSAFKTNSTVLFDDYPEFVPDFLVPQDREPGKLHIELRCASRAAASSSFMLPDATDDGELQLISHTLSSATEGGNVGQPGLMYLITLPTGEEIEIRGDHDQTETPLSSQGLLQATIVDGPDLPEKLQRVENHLKTMGLELRLADDTDLELFYWRHLVGILQDRCDSRIHNKFQDARATVDTNLDRDEQITRHRAAFATLTTPEQIADWIAQGGHLPVFMHQDLRQPNQPCGKPFWNRFDVTPEQCAKKEMPSVRYRSGPEHIVRTGVCLSTEARIRAYAFWHCGQSSLDDMNEGSAGFLFLRQNWETLNVDNVTLFFSPHILRRTSTYAYGTDHFGRLKDRKDHAHWLFERLTGIHNSGNELLVKDAVSLLDDVELAYFYSLDARLRAIEYLHKLGITHIRGLPVEERIIDARDSMQRHDAISRARATLG